MNESLRHAFIDLYKLPLLEDLRECLEVCGAARARSRGAGPDARVGRLLQLRFPHSKFDPVPPRGTLDLSVVLQSKYFFS